MPASPTARTLAECKRLNWPAGVVERHNTYSHTKHDLFGCIDIVAMDGQPGLLGIQATGGGNGTARVRKILGPCADLAWQWVKAGNRLEVWDWKKYKTRENGRYWRFKRYEIKEGDFYADGQAQASN